MSSGRREIVFNTQERAISVDLNRAQKFANQDSAELLRYLLDVSANDDLDAGAVATETLGSTSPLRAEIIGGLLVRPQVGTTFSTVDGGVVNAIAPDNATDDSVYKYIRHVGTGETLNVASNASGSIRIDVIECRPAPGQSQVSDSRDVFNPSTGLFTAVQVVKETKGYLEFRVRQGTPGAGFPGTAVGWLPLAIASVPNGSTSNDTVTFWDVRPLISDREFGPFALSSEIPRSPSTYGRITNRDGADQGGVLTGTTVAFFNGRRVGGRLRRGSPGIDAQSIDLNDTANLEPGVNYASAYRYFVYLVVPFGLPRWARYTDASTGSRVPRSCRGIPIMSKVQPGDLAGRPSVPIAFPAVFGFTGNTSSDAVCIVASKVESTNGRTTVTTELSGTRQYFGQFTGISIAGVAINATNHKFTLTPGVDFPKNVRRLILEMRWDHQVPAAGNLDGRATLVTYPTLYPGLPGGQDWTTQGIGAPLANPTAGAITRTQTARCEIDVPLSYPNATVPFDVVLQGAATIGASALAIVGWDF